MAKSVVAQAARCEIGGPMSFLGLNDFPFRDELRWIDPVAFMFWMSRVQVTHPSPSSSSAVISDGKSLADDAPVVPIIRDL